MRRTKGTGFNSERECPRDVPYKTGDLYVLELNRSGYYRSTVTCCTFTRCNTLELFQDLELIIFKEEELLKIDQ